MASNSKKLAANINLGVIGKATELKKRIWFVIGALLVYRLGTYIPLPGVDSKALAEIFAQQQGGLMDVFNMFSGGALGRMTIFALNIMPYITVSIIIQLLTMTLPALQALKKEGEAGRRKINQYTRYGTVLMAAVQSMGIITLLESSGFSGALVMSGTFFRVSIVVTLVGGVLFLMWLGEQINSRGIGNGISLIIFAGIVAELPRAVVQTLELSRKDAGVSTIMILGVLALAIGLIAFIVFMERAQRRILIQYPKRQVGNKQYGGENSHLPLKLNTAGVLPPIFASSLLLFPATMAGFSGQNPNVDSLEGTSNSTDWITDISAILGQGQPMYLFLFVVFIWFFCFFYAKNGPQNPKDTAENLKKNGGFIPGIRPGKNTANYLNFVLNRITVIGAAYISLVCVIPELLMAKYDLPFYLGGTSLLIIVNVSMDTVAQIHSHLIAHQYEGLIKKAKLNKGRSGRR